MKFRNPWIDPRVEQVRAAAVRAYLLAHGWKSLGSEPLNFESFESPGGEGGCVVQLPLREGGRDYLQRAIELLTELALAEDRYAVEVLGDILNQSVGNGTPQLPTTPAQTDSPVH